MSLESDIQDILGLAQRSSKAQDDFSNKFRELQEKIRNGESTGDKIKDFGIAFFGDISGERIEPYRQLDKKLNENIGNSILVVEQSESIQGCPGIVAPEFIRPEFLSIDTDLKLGVLTADLQIDYKRGLVVVPTKTHVRKQERYSRDKWQLEDGPIQIPFYNLVGLNVKVSRRTRSMRNDCSEHYQNGLSVFAGSEVEKFFIRGRFLDFEGELSEEMAEKWMDTSYVMALNLLGKEAPEKFRKKYDAEVYAKRVETIGGLEELSTSAVKLQTEINRIMGKVDKRPTLGGRVMYSTQPELPRMNEDEARIHSMRYREELKEVRGQIIERLGRAIELGIHKENFKLEMKPGVSMNVPEYIAGLCKEYNIKLPNGIKPR